MVLLYVLAIVLTVRHIGAYQWAYRWLYSLILMATYHFVVVLITGGQKLFAALMIRDEIQTLVVSSTGA